VQQWMPMLFLLRTSWWICTASAGLVCCGCMNQRGLQHSTTQHSTAHMTVPSALAVCRCALLSLFCLDSMRTKAGAHPVAHERHLHLCNPCRTNSCERQGYGCKVERSTALP
jgi:hypothetical protein